MILKLFKTNDSIITIITIAKMLPQGNTLNGIPEASCILSRIVAQLRPASALMCLAIPGSKLPECVERCRVRITNDILGVDMECKLCYSSSL